MKRKFNRYKKPRKEKTIDLDMDQLDDLLSGLKVATCRKGMLS